MMNEFFGISVPMTSLIQLLITLFLAVLFLQSGLDKVFDFKGNLSYFTDHFSGSPLAPTVALMTLVITITETAAGILCALGVVWLLLFGSADFAFLGTLVCALNLIMLFFGQRMAKDYGGAAILVPYFILTMIGLYVLA